jgi:hypothetical protein
MPIGSLEEMNRQDARHLRFVEQVIRRSGETAMNIFSEPGFKENAERFQLGLRLDADRVRLPVIENQVRILIHRIPPRADIIKGSAIGEGFDGEGPDSFPVVLLASFMQDEARATKRPLRLSNAGL